MNTQCEYNSVPLLRFTTTTHSLLIVWRSSARAGAQHPEISFVFDRQEWEKRSNVHKVDSPVPVETKGKNAKYLSLSSDRAC